MISENLLYERDRLLASAISDRIFYLMQPSWWPFDIAVDVLQTLRQLNELPNDDRPQSLLLTAESGMGKSTVLRYYRDMKPPIREADTGILRQATLYILLPPAPSSAEDLLKEIMRTVGLRPNVQKFPDLLRYFKLEIPKIGIEVLVIDEVNRIKNYVRSQRNYVLELFKCIPEILGRPLVLSATPEVTEYFRLDPHLRRRFRHYKIPDWRVGKSAQQFIKSILEDFPFREGYEHKIFEEREVIDAILKAGEYTTGGILRILRSSAEQTLRKKREYLSMRDVMSSISKGL